MRKKGELCLTMIRIIMANANKLRLRKTYRNSWGRRSERRLNAAREGKSLVDRALPCLLLGEEGGGAEDVRKQERPKPLLEL